VPSKNSGDQQEPVDWFQRHVLAGLNDLKQGQLTLENSIHQHAESSTKALADHVASDQREFSYVKSQLAALKPVRMMVYGAAAMIMATVFGALIAMVVHQVKP
jgi:hypothetical protein